MQYNYMVRNKITINILVVLFLGLIVIVGVWKMLTSNEELGSVVSEGVLIEKVEGWGPCPPDSVCQQTTKLDYAGRLELEGEKQMVKQLSQTELEEVIILIRKTGIMKKSCPSERILDYSARYTIKLGREEKVIEFPGCEQELEEISLKLSELVE